MTIKRNKFKCLILMLGALLTLGLQPLLVQANTTDVDSHFSVEMVETSDSKVRGEAVQVTVKNITNQTGKNILAKVDLPKNFADKLGKTSVTETVGTLAAGESKSFIISLSDGSTQVLPITGTSLPITGERVASLALIVGLVLLMSLGVILRKRKLTSLLFALLVITGGSVADASTTYHHAVTQIHRVTAAGQTSAFKTHVSGDFGATENDNPSDENPTDDKPTGDKPTGDKPSDDKPTSAKRTLSFDLNYVPSETLPSQELVANELATQPTVPERLGYSFEGWYEKDAVTAFDFSTPIQKDITLYAKWIAETYNVAYKLDGGTNYTEAPTTYTIESDTITLGTPNKANYVFDGWFSDDQFETQVTTIAQGSTGDVTLYAKWTANTYTVSVAGGTGGVASPTTYTYKETETTNIALTRPTAPTGQIFESWSVPAGTTLSGDTLTIEAGTSGDKTVTALWKSETYSISFDANGGTGGGASLTSYTYNGSGPATVTLTKPTAPTGQAFDQWEITGGDTTVSGNTLIVKAGSTGFISIKTLWKAASIARVHFRSYNDKADVLPDQEIYAANPNLAIPAAPAKDNHYFLGWAESANAAKTETLYVPDDDSIQSKLNVPDQAYLGYAVKPEHTIQNITADTTLYAVYYKAKDAVKIAGDEFIWADAIWRNLKTDMDATIPGNQALVIKFNALTISEATGAGSTTDYYNPNFIESSRTTYFSDTGENGYEAADNNVRKANDYYYANSLSSGDKASVNKVALDNPSYDGFKSEQSFSASAYNEWNHWTDFYKDARFKTTLDEGGSKQAFALSYGDINTTMGLTSSTGRTLLSFTGSNVDYFWVRSAGYNNVCAGYVGTGYYYNYRGVNYPRPVRPALSLQNN